MCCNHRDLYLTLDWLGIPPKVIHPAVHTGSTRIHVPWYSNSCTLPVKPISAHGEITMGPQLRIVHQAYSYQPKLYQFAVWSSGRLAAGFEPGTCCMGGVCASHYATQPRKCAGTILMGKTLVALIFIGGWVMSHFESFWIRIKCTFFGDASKMIH